ncbi:MAG TPA: DNA-binding response regulator [Candidatus Fournierella pullicola]|uniref:DNA-binding response regulator n=1 Tax=Candidatus Allofournierella pullicola TaxID=2838596 RepID=A0A9D1V4B7_9FIRM|nr:DNA-binding response regulator [Candidatus Fournierella pullicola]
MRILLVEDEEYMAQAVAQVLGKNNYTVDLAHEGDYGLDCALSGIYDIIILNPYTLSLFCKNESFKLTLKESQLLEMLMNARGGVLSKERIIEKVWGFDSEAEDRHVEVYISFLRKKLKALGAQTSIETVRGMGYGAGAGIHGGAGYNHSGGGVQRAFGDRPQRP